MRTEARGNYLSEAHGPLLTRDNSDYL